MYVNVINDWECCAGLNNARGPRLPHVFLPRFRSLRSIPSVGSLVVIPEVIKKRWYPRLLSASKAFKKRRLRR